MAGQELTSKDLQVRDVFFARIIAQHARLLYRVAYSVLRHPDEAEDAVADALLKMLRTGAWQRINNERAFLARTTWRCALDRLQSRPQSSEDEALLLRLRDRAPSPELAASLSEDRRLLHLLIDRLPSELRDPLLLSVVEELDSREIGEVLHLPEGTVRTRCMRARQQLRAQYLAMHTTANSRELSPQGAS